MNASEMTETVCPSAARARHARTVALLTGGADRPYAYGLATTLFAHGMTFDVVAGDELECPELTSVPQVRFLNLRGGHSRDVGLAAKALRVLAYYGRLIAYAWRAEPPVFHVLWNNKFETFDRTLLLLYYKLRGKKIAYTAHNVNAGKRDGTDSALNRLTLAIQYRLADHIFVHTEKMKRELVEDFGIQAAAVSVVPFGINNAVPNTALTREAARRRLGLAAGEKTILFFGNIAPYKGLEYAVAAFQRLASERDDYRLVIGGRPRGGCEGYWEDVRASIARDPSRDRVLARIEYIPDDETEVYFKAADVLVLPYTRIFQSGVLFLAYSFGLPVIAADIGSLAEDVVEGETGFMFRSEDAGDLARVLQKYFASDLFARLESRRRSIQDYANSHHSWDTAARLMREAYTALLAD